MTIRGITNFPLRRFKSRYNSAGFEEFLEILSQGFTEFFLGVHTIPRQRKSQGWIQRFDQGSFFSPLFSIKAVIVPDFLLDVKHFFATQGKQSASCE